MQWSIGYELNIEKNRFNYFTLRPGLVANFPLQSSDVNIGPADLRRPASYAPSAPSDLLCVPDLLTLGRHLLLSSYSPRDSGIMFVNHQIVVAISVPQVTKTNAATQYESPPAV